MARKSKQDRAKAKAAKQKKIVIVGAVLLVALLAYQAPKMMKMLNQKPNPVVTTGTPAAATGAPTDPNALAAPTLAGAPVTAATATPTATATDLVSAVPVEADPGQLETFDRFATKDPFVAQTSSSGAPAATPAKTPAKTPPKTPPAPPAPPAAPTAGGSSTPPAPPTAAPSSAVISVNGELVSVAVGTDFPQSGATFSRVGAIFHLVALTAKTAKIAISGGSYADGAAAITLKLGRPLTLQNTADGTKYTLILEPPSTQVSTAGTSTGGTSTTPVVPATSGSGG